MTSVNSSGTQRRNGSGKGFSGGGCVMLYPITMELEKETTLVRLYTITMVRDVLCRGGDNDSCRLLRQIVFLTELVMFSRLEIFRVWVCVERDIKSEGTVY